MGLKEPRHGMLMLVMPAPPLVAAKERSLEVRHAIPTFEELYDGQVQYLWRTARALGVPESSVEDVLQDVFVVVHRRLPEFEGRASARTWATRILYHVVLEHRRRFRTKAAHVELPEDVPDDSSPPDHEAERAQALRLLSSILDDMNEEQRVVFVLAEIEGTSVPDIAEIVGVNVNTVYSRLRLARRDYERHLARIRAKNEWRSR